MMFVAVVPDTFQIVAAILGLEWKARAMLVVSNLTLFVVAAYLFNRVSRLYDRVSRLNEELSLLRNAVEERGDLDPRPRREATDDEGGDTVAQHVVDD